MRRLHVRVWLHDVLVEDRFVAVRDVVHVGEGDDAVVAFPSADLEVARRGDALFLRGAKLDEKPVVVELGPVSVALSSVVPERAHLARWFGPDPTVPVLVGAIVVAVMAMQTAFDVVRANPASAATVAQVASWFDPAAGGAPRTARMKVADDVWAGEVEAWEIEDTGFDWPPVAPPVVFVPGSSE